MATVRKMTKPAEGNTERASLLPRKLPRQDRAASTVAAIVEAAASLLETDGFDGYTTNAIATRAGVSIGSLYQYFPNKTALTRALIARENEALSRQLAQLIERPAGIDRVHELIQIAVEHQLKRPVLARLLDVEGARLSPDDDKRHLNDMRQVIFRRCLGDRMFKGDGGAAKDLFAIIQAMVDGAGQRGENDHHALARCVERVVFAYIDSLRPPLTDEWPSA